MTWSNILTCNPGVLECVVPSPIERDGQLGVCAGDGNYSLLTVSPSPVSL